MRTWCVCLSARASRLANRSCLLQTITSDYTPLQRRVESVVQIAMAIVTPLSALAPGKGSSKAPTLADDLHKVKKRFAENGSALPIVQEEGASA